MADKDKMPFTFEILGPKEQFDVCAIFGRNSIKCKSSQCMMPRTNFWDFKTWELEKKGFGGINHTNKPCTLVQTLYV